MNSCAKRDFAAKSTTNVDELLSKACDIVCPLYSSAWLAEAWNLPCVCIIVFDTFVHVFQILPRILSLDDQ